MADFPAGSANAAVAAVLVPTTTYYLALFTQDPGSTGASHEVTGGSYARQTIVFGNPSSGVSTSTDAQTFAGMPAEATSLWVGIFSAASAGTFLWGDANAAVTGPIPAGATVQFNIGAVTAAIS